MKKVFNENKRTVTAGGGAYETGSMKIKTYNIFLGTYLKLQYV